MAVAPIYDDEDDQDAAMPVCEGCNCDVVFENTVVLVQVVFSSSHDGDFLSSVDVYKAHGGEPVYDPLFYCESCLEAVLEKLRDLNKDALPFENEEHAIVCDYCESGIAFKENCAELVFGDVEVSKKTGLPKFVPKRNKPRKFMCCRCVIQLVVPLGIPEEEKAEWQGDLWSEFANDDECAQCVFDRCWRGATTGCLCWCHGI
jgi:hypothetical protein